MCQTMCHGDRTQNTSPSQTWHGCGNSCIYEHMMVLHHTWLGWNYCIEQGTTHFLLIKLLYYMGYNSVTVHVVYSPLLRLRKYVYTVLCQNTSRMMKQCFWEHMHLVGHMARGYLAIWVLLHHTLAASDANQLQFVHNLLDCSQSYT